MNFAFIALPFVGNYLNITIYTLKVFLLPCSILIRYSLVWLTPSCFSAEENCNEASEANFNDDQPAENGHST